MSGFSDKVFLLLILKADCRSRFKKFLVKEG